MRLLVVENKPSERSTLMRLCNQHPDVRVIARVDSGADAIDVARTHQPDVVLLDFDQLRDMNGIQVLEALEGSPGPLTIVLSESQHTDAEVPATGNVVEFLTKPVDEKRFESALGRVRARLVRDRRVDTPRYLIAEREDRLFFLPVEAIDCIRADGVYVAIQSGQERYSARDSLGRLAEVLGGADFIRINRSLLVNMRRIAYAERVGRGIYAFTLSNGQRYNSARSFRRDFFLGKYRMRIREPR